MWLKEQNPNPFFQRNFSESQHSRNHNHSRPRRRRRARSVVPSHARNAWFRLREFRDTKCGFSNRSWSPIWWSMYVRSKIITEEKCRKKLIIFLNRYRKTFGIRSRSPPSGKRRSRWNYPFWYFSEKYKQSCNAYIGCNWWLLWSARNFGPKNSSKNKRGKTLVVGES